MLKFEFIEIDICHRIANVVLVTLTFVSKIRSFLVMQWLYKMRRQWMSPVDVP